MEKFSENMSGIDEKKHSISEGGYSMPNTEKMDRLSDLNAMTTEELRELLRAEIESDEDDTDLVLNILEVIRKRREEGQIDNPVDVDQAWADFQKYYAAPDGRRKDRHVSRTDVYRKRGIKLAVSLAAIFTVMILAVPKASGFTDIWDMFVEWTGDVFSFSNKYEGDPIESKLENPEKPETFKNLQEALDAYDVKVPLAPKWIPGGYEVFKVAVEHMSQSDKMVFTAAYRNSEKQVIAVMISKYETTDPHISESDEKQPDEYVVNNITHYVFKNYDRQVVSWYNGQYEGIISGMLSDDEVKNMIDSIYKEVS